MSKSNLRQVFISTRSVYLWCLVIYIVCMALFVAPFVQAHGLRAILMRPIHLGLALLLLYVHELLHLFGFRVAGGVTAGRISLRMSWRHLTPHVELRAPTSVRRTRFAALLPGLVTGVVPLIAGAIAGDGRLLFMGVLMTTAAGGDVAIVAALRGLAPATEVELGAAWSRRS
jgi:Putative zincin peptidase